MFHFYKKQNSSPISKCDNIKDQRKKLFILTLVLKDDTEHVMLFFTFYLSASSSNFF